LEQLTLLQAGLERLYRLDPAPAVSGFLVENRTNPATREQLLLIEGEELQLGLVLDQGALSTFEDALLAEHNLDPFCLVVEGVSHFLFVMHRARHDRPTSALELELQSEVDKYVAALLLAQRCPKLPPERLRHRLYSGYALVDGLHPEQQRRYHRANLLAKRYSRRLEERFVRASQLGPMLDELRRFYRMPCWAKQELIARAS